MQRVHIDTKTTNIVRNNKHCMKQQTLYETTNIVCDREKHPKVMAIFTNNRKKFYEFFKIWYEQIVCVRAFLSVRTFFSYILLNKKLVPYFYRFFHAEIFAFEYFITMFYDRSITMIIY